MIFFSLVPGFMLGFEWQYDYGFVVVDLGILRILIDYKFFGAVEEEVNNASQAIESHQNQQPPEQSQ